MSETVDININVNATGEDKVKKVDDSMGKLEKTTKNLRSNTEDYNKSVVKTIPQLQAFNPLMSELGLSSLITTGALGLAGLGVVKFGQSVIETHGNIVDLGIAMGNLTSGPANNFVQTSDQITQLARLMNTTTTDAAGAFQTLLTATHSQSTAMELMVKVNKVAIDTHKSLADVSKVAAQYYAQGGYVQGVYQPQGMGAATKELGVMETQKTSEASIWSNIGRFFSRLTSTGETGFLGNPHGWMMPAQVQGATNNATGPAANITINLDGQKVGGIVLDSENGTIRARGGQ